MTRTPPDRLLHANYPFATPVIARYADVDPFWHVNNVAMAQYLEETRISMLRTILGRERLVAPGWRILLAHVSIDYLREGAYPGSFDVRAAIGKVGRTSVTVVLGAFQDNACIALSDAVLVRLDETGPKPWTADERKGLDDPVWRLQPMAATSRSS
jgi:acyl-CoA thioester hydrolase